MDSKITEGKWVLKKLCGNNLIVSDKNNCLLDITNNTANAKLISKAPEMLEMLNLLTNEFNLAKSLLRTQRNERLKILGESLLDNDISQKDYNKFVDKFNLETKLDSDIVQKAKQLIEEATKID